MGTAASVALNVSICNADHCPNKAVTRGYCEQHTTPRTPRGTHAGRQGSTYAWRKIRARILRRDGHRCTFALNDGTRCGATATEVDHIIELADGGTDHPSNLRAACHPHHAAKTTAERHRRR
jgi:5-methylcytosine-specific restriction protein A